MDFVGEVKHVQTLLVIVMYALHGPMAPVGSAVVVQMVIENKRDLVRVRG